MSTEKRRFVSFGLCAASFLIALHFPIALAAPDEARVTRLQRSINVGLNFDSAPPLTFTREPLSRSDIRMLKADGFTHLRVLLWVESWMPRFAIQAVIDQNYALLDADLAVWLDEGIAVTLTPGVGSWSDPDAIHAELFSTAEGIDDLEAFWSQLALRYSSLDPELLSFEVFNEPRAITGSIASDCQFNACAPPTWRSIQASIVDTIRAAAPEHTIHVTGADFSNYGALLQLTPYADTNLVYIFHYYYPHLFTFQAFNPEIIDLPYPACMPIAQSLVDAIRSPSTRANAQAYLDEDWREARIRSDIDAVVNWATSNQVRVFANELGAHGNEVDSEIRYIRDLRRVLEEKDIGWSIWSTTDVYTQGWIPDGRLPVIDMLRPLGLRPWLLDTPACLAESTPVSDIAVSVNQPDPVITGNSLSYSIGIENLGLDPASKLSLRHSLPDHIDPASVSTDVGDCEVSAKLIDCRIGNLASGQSALISVIASTSGPGLAQVPVIAVADEKDSNEINNSGLVDFAVNDPVPLMADLSVGVVNPDPVIVGNDLSYRITVRNLGPDSATGLSLIHSLPDGIEPVSTDSTVGTCTVFDNTIDCDFGSLDNGQSVQLDVFATTSAPGDFQVSAHANADEIDADETNNSRLIEFLVHKKAAETVEDVLTAIKLYLKGPDASKSARQKIKLARKSLSKAQEKLAKNRFDSGLSQIGKALKDLLKAENKGADVAGHINLLAQISRLTAQEAIDQAKSAPFNDPALIAIAEIKLNEGQALHDTGKADTAVKSYKNALQNAHDAILPAILGSFVGKYDNKTTRCEDKKDNGTSRYRVVTSITSIAGAEFTGTAVGTIIRGNASSEERFSLEGSLTADGRISGQALHTHPGSSAGGSFSGKLSGDKLTMLVKTKDLAGDSCKYTRDISMARE